MIIENRVRATLSTILSRLVLSIGKENKEAILCEGMDDSYESWSSMVFVIKQRGESTKCILI